MITVAVYVHIGRSHDHIYGYLVNDMPKFCKKISYFSLTALTIGVFS